MLEEIPRHGPGLDDELRRVGGEVRQATERELAGLYPADPDGSAPIAYLWARTVRCEVPTCGAETPLMHSLWLAKKAVFRRERGERIKVRGRQALRYRIVRAAKGPPRVEWEMFQPRSWLPHTRPDGVRPDDPVVVVVLFDRGGRDTAHPDAVAPHFQGARAAVLVEAYRVHRFAVLAADLDPAADG